MKIYIKDLNSNFETEGNIKELFIHKNKLAVNFKAARLNTTAYFDVTSLHNGHIYETKNITIEIDNGLEEETSVNMLTGQTFTKQVRNIYTRVVDNHIAKLEF